VKATNDVVAFVFHRLSGTPLDLRAIARTDKRYRYANEFDRAAIETALVSGLKVRRSATDNVEGFRLRISSGVSEYDPVAGSFQIKDLNGRTFFPFSRFGRKYALSMENQLDFQEWKVPIDEAKELVRKLMSPYGGRSVDLILDVQLTGADEHALDLGMKNVLRGHIVNMTVRSMRRGKEKLAVLKAAPVVVTKAEGPGQGSKNQSTIRSAASRTDGAQLSLPSGAYVEPSPEVVAMVYHNLIGREVDFPALAKKTKAYRRASNFDRPKVKEDEAFRLESLLGETNKIKGFKINTRMSLAPYDTDDESFTIRELANNSMFTYDAFGKRFTIAVQNGDAFARWSMPLEAARDIADRADYGTGVRAEMVLAASEAVQLDARLNRRNVIHAHIVSLRLTDASNRQLAQFTAEDPPPPKSVPSPTITEFDIRGFRVGMTADEALKAGRSVGYEWPMVKVKNDALTDRIVKECRAEGEAITAAPSERMRKDPNPYVRKGFFGGDPNLKEYRLRARLMCVARKIDMKANIVREMIFVPDGVDRGYNGQPCPRANAGLPPCIVVWFDGGTGKAQRIDFMQFAQGSQKPELTERLRERYGRPIAISSFRQPRLLDPEQRALGTRPPSITVMGWGRSYGEKSPLGHPKEKLYDLQAGLVHLPGSRKMVTRLHMVLTDQPAKATQETPKPAASKITF